MDGWGEGERSLLRRVGGGSKGLSHPLETRRMGEGSLPRVESEGGAWGYVEAKQTKWRRP